MAAQPDQQSFYSPTRVGTRTTPRYRVPLPVGGFLLSPGDDVNPTGASPLAGFLFPIPALKDAYETFMPPSSPMLSRFLYSQSRFGKDPAMLWIHNRLHLDIHRHRYEHSLYGAINSILGYTYRAADPTTRWLIKPQGMIKEYIQQTHLSDTYYRDPTKPPASGTHDSYSRAFVADLGLTAHPDFVVAQANYWTLDPDGWPLGDLIACIIEVKPAGADVEKAEAQLQLAGTYAQGGPLHPEARLYLIFPKETRVYDTNRNQLRTLGTGTDEWYLELEEQSARVADYDLRQVTVSVPART